MYAALKPVVRRPWAIPSFPFNRKAISREILVVGIRLTLYRLSLDFIFICLHSALALTIYLLQLTMHFLCSFLRHILSFLDDIPKIFSYAEILYLFVIAGIVSAFPNGRECRTISCKLLFLYANHCGRPKPIPAAHM